MNKSQMTETDKSFAQAKPDYYIFEKEMVKPWDGGEGRCLNCNKRFRTHLLLCRFCSRECQVAILQRLSTLAHAPEPRPLAERIKSTPPPVDIKRGSEIKVGLDKVEARKKYKREWMAKKRAEKKKGQ